MKYYYICLIALSLFISGCATNYYAAAVKNARSYALEKFPDLDEEALHWVRFTSPQIQQDILYRPENEYGQEPFAQTYFVWDIPKYDGKSLVVVGFGREKLKNWYPVRAMFKRYRYIESDSTKKTSNKRSKKKRKKKRLSPLSNDSKKSSF